MVVAFSAGGLAGGHEHGGAPHAPSVVRACPLVHAPEELHVAPMRDAGGGSAPGGCLEDERQRRYPITCTSSGTRTSSGTSRMERRRWASRSMYSEPLGVMRMGRPVPSQETKPA